MKREFTRFYTLLACILQISGPVFAMESGAEKLIKAVKSGDSKNVKSLIKKLKHSKNVALISATENGHGHIVRILLKEDIMLTVLDRALKIATEKGYIDIISLFLEKNPSTLAKDLSLLITTRSIKTEEAITIAKLLLKAGANPNAETKLEVKPLHWASARGQKNMVELLLKAGADTKAQDPNNDDFTPLHWASEEGHLPVVKQLISANANIEAKDQHGNTALHLAAIKGHIPTVSFLVEAGASRDAKNKDGHTPRNIAKHQVKEILHQPECIICFQKLGRGGMLIPCVNRHQDKLCQECCKKINICPLCKTPFSRH
jgi:ankyrin repeat protein